MSRGQKVRPQFSFGEHNQAGIDSLKRPVHCPRKIKRPIENVQVRETLASFGVACVRGGRYHALPVWMLLLKSGHNLSEKMNLAHADAVKPCAWLVRVTKESLTGDLTPQASPIFAGGKCL